MWEIFAPRLFTHTHTHTRLPSFHGDVSRLDDFKVKYGEVRWGGAERGSRRWGWNIDERI